MTNIVDLHSRQPIEEAFKKNVERDRRKLSKCRRNGVRIVYVRTGYDIGEIIHSILNEDEGR